jgi:glycosyltransferase involved in cell wall biosynthesis/GT2 family glycosyltransferase
MDPSAARTPDPSPTVSVVIPTYNRARWLPETVASVLAQTAPPLEIIIVDDGSTDDTLEVCSGFPGPVRCIRQDNRGVGAARNRGAAEARGQWIAFLDSDDLWTPDKLEVQLAALHETGADWSITDCQVMDLHGRTLDGVQGFQRAFPVFRDLDLAPDPFFARHLAAGEVRAAGRTHRIYHGSAHVPLFYGNFVSPATAMVRRELFQETGGFDETFRYAEETEFFHRLSPVARVAVVMSPLFRWRTGQPVSLVSPGNVEALIRNAMRSLDGAAELGAPLDGEALSAYRTGRRFLLSRLASHQVSTLDTAGARVTLREARRAGARLSPRWLALLAASRLPQGVLRRAHTFRRRLRRGSPPSAPWPLRIALLLESDGPGGAERMLLLLAEALRRRGHQVVPVGPADGVGWLGDEFRARGFEPEVFRLRRSLDPRCALGLVRLFREKGVHVAHSHEFTMAVYGAAAARMRGIPHLVTMHGGMYFEARRRRRVALRWAFRQSARAVAVSGATRAELERGLRADDLEIDVVLNGVPEQVGDRHRVRRELGLAADDRLILAVGSLYPVKGYDILLEALGTLSAQPGWRLAVAGQGGEEPRLREQARREGLGDRVHLLGFRDDIPDLLAAADVYVMPSRSEGLPLALLEAMFAGLPVVASAVGGIPDALGEGGGILVPPGDAPALAAALRALLTDDERRRVLGSRAGEIAGARFGVDAMADAYERLYREAVGAGRPQDRSRTPAKLRGAPAGMQ